MNWKWIVFPAVLVAALTVFTLLANGPKMSASRADIDWDAVEAAYDDQEVLTVVWMGPPYSSTAQEGGWIETELEKCFRLELKPVFLAGADYMFKKPMMFAGGVVPDVTWEADPINVQKDARNGFIIPVPYPLLLRHAPAYVRLINDTAPEAWLYSYYREPGEAFGRNMGVPTIWSDGVYGSPGVWRKDWLAKVGIETVPETLDQMHAALLKFRNGDPDGNGKKDTYGLSANSSWWFRMFGEIFGAFGAKTDTKGMRPFDWIERDGAIVWGGVTDEARDAVVMLRQWYAEGIIHPDFVLDDDLATERKFLNGRTGYLSHGGNWWRFNPDASSTFATTFKQMHPRGELAIGTPPIGVNGHRGVRVWGGGGNTMVFGQEVRDTPEVVIRMLKMWNEMAAACYSDARGDDNLMVRSKCGKLDLHYTYRDPEIGPNGGIKSVPPFSDPNKARAAVVGLGLAGGTFFSPCGASVDLTNHYRNRKQVAFMAEHQKRRWGLTDAFLKPDVVPSAGRYLDPLRKYQKSVYTDIITGRLPVAAFDEFRANWYARGGEVMTAEANSLYKDFQRIREEVGLTRPAAATQP